MNHKALTHLLTTAFVLIFLSSCDPAQILILKSEPGTQADICLYGDEFLSLNSDQIQSDSLTSYYCLSMEEEEEKYEKTFLFGVGTWSNHNIQELVELLDSIVIIQSTQKPITIRKNELEDFLKSNISGFPNNILTIEAK